jgi:hypothetical protein
MISQLPSCQLIECTKDNLRTMKIENIINLFIFSYLEKINSFDFLN